MHTSKWLLKAQQIEAMEGVVKTHFLNPNAIRLNKSLGDAVGMQHLGFHLITVQPGRDSTEYHKHHYEDECVYILSGSGTAVIEGIEYAVAAGDFLGFPSGEASHELSNTGSEPLVCLVAGQRLDHEICDYPHLNKRLYAHQGQRDVVDFKHILPP